MKPLIIALSAALALAGAQAVSAAAMADMKGMAMPGPALKSGKGTGVVMAIDSAAGTVTIQHGPIAAIGWPGMTMAFKASPSTMLKTLKVGQKIGFDVSIGAGPPRVTAIRRK